MSYSHPHAPPDSLPPKISRHPMPTAVHPPTAQPSFELPKIGETRCYWSLLTYPSLSFSYLDPVLQYHLQDRAPMLLGRSLLDFVHPEDQDYVRRDLGSVLQTGNMYGSETRVRFARLSQVQKQLSEAAMSVGSSTSAVSDRSPWPNHPWISAVTLDDQWMPVNLVINRPANSVILCFIHAAVDIDEYADNDPAACAITQDGRRRAGWSNWCGTGPLGNPELRDIWDALNGIASICANETEIAESRLFRFQLLSNNPSSKHEVLISWPPDSSTFPDHNIGGYNGSRICKTCDKCYHLRHQSDRG
ncbi:hypothetical protein DL96DRAFT_1280951 [Flagelloscypha sp. PMI_526]|nr:hypothetical protein DL96DRAFT_1280951 [Flagelloscypha sp. PMI_526]